MDRVLQEVIARLNSGHLNSIDQKSDGYSNLRVKVQISVASTSEGIVLPYDTHNVVPYSLQRRVIDLSHEGHQGVVKTK